MSGVMEFLSVSSICISLQGVWLLVLDLFGWECFLGSSCPVN